MTVVTFTAEVPPAKDSLAVRGDFSFITSTPVGSSIIVGA